MARVGALFGGEFTFLANVRNLDVAGVHNENEFTYVNQPTGPLHNAT
jgi:hypothetical protein